MVKTHNSRAFTLIELIISILLMGIVAGLLASIIAVNFDTLAEVSDRKKLVTRGMLAVNLFQRELGMLIDSTSIVTADEQQFRFNDKYGNTWEYKVTSNSFTRQEVGVGTAMVLATPVVNADTKFTYWAADNSELSSVPLIDADRRNVRLVKLVLVMDDRNSGIPLLSMVYPENMKIYNR